MEFLVVSQRAIPSPDYNLKDLTGHGRFDVFCRCILSACRELITNQKDGSKIYCFFSNTPNELESGWLTFGPLSSEEDEISIAYRLKENWNNYFTSGSFQDLLSILSSKKIIFLCENGIQFDSSLINKTSEYLIILGAQNDLTEEKLKLINSDFEFSLGSIPMLASQAITYFRQLYLQSK